VTRRPRRCSPTSAPGMRRTADADPADLTSPPGRT
jgi:hypothetical protein